MKLSKLENYVRIGGREKTSHQLVMRAVVQLFVLGKSMLSIVQLIEDSV